MSTSRYPLFSNNFNNQYWKSGFIVICCVRLWYRWHVGMEWKSIPNPHFALQWRHNEVDGVSNHQPQTCLLGRLFGRRSKKTSKLRVTGKKTPKLRVTGLCAGNSPSPGTGEFPAQMASNAENVCILWRHHGPLQTNSLVNIAGDHITYQHLVPQCLVFSRTIELQSFSV